MTLDPFRLGLPFLRLLDPEAAHKVTIAALKSGATRIIHPKADDAALGVDLFGLHFPNPVGLSAGFDKNAEVPDAMLGLGFGFVEVGSITPRPQPGNPKPRIFRLPQQRAVINRLGFNNDGFEAARPRLQQRGRHSGVVGVNLGANKDSDDRQADYVAGVQTLGPFASYITVNISSPNTPGLRALQGREELAGLIAGVDAARHNLPNDPPVLLKIAPDLIAEELEDVAQVVMESAIDGLIVSNTTIAGRDKVSGAHAGETGGLSGGPLFELSTQVLRDVYRLTEGKLPLIGVGGISSGADAYAKIRAGASLVQLYTALIYEGPGLVGEIKRDLLKYLHTDGYESIVDAIGADHA